MLYYIITYFCEIIIGTGKSSTISKYTGQNVATSKGASSLTRYCELYANLRNTAEPVWIDTVGYDDSKKLKDEDSFKEVLKFIDKHDVRDVHGIVWTVMPQERMDARYVQLMPCTSTGPKIVCAGPNFIV